MASGVPSPLGDGTRVADLLEVISFEAFFRREYHGLVSMAWGLTGSREIAEDIAQESLLNLHQRWEGDGSIQNPSAYVRRTCSNLAISTIRRRMAEARALLRHGPSAPAEQMPDSETELFWSEVRRLPHRQAQVVALFYGYSLTVHEVSEILELSAGTTKSHLFRARRTLAGRLNTDVDGGDSHVD